MSQIECSRTFKKLNIIRKTDKRLLARLQNQITECEKAYSCPPGCEVRLLRDEISGSEFTIGGVTRRVAKNCWNCTKLESNNESVLSIDPSSGINTVTIPGYHRTCSVNDEISAPNRKCVVPDEFKVTNNPVAFYVSRGKSN